MHSHRTRHPGVSTACSHSCPAWLAERLRSCGGAVSFGRYMDWVLHDPEHGAYGSGRLQVGPRGDFATSPSLGSDFAALLAPQLAQWLQQLAHQQHEPLMLLEAGPGEGDLAADLAQELASGWPALAERLELVLIEPNAGMAARQRQRLRGCPLPVRWSSLEELATASGAGVMLAHEVLDALPVERVIWDGGHWRLQQVVLDDEQPEGPRLRLLTGAPLDPGADAPLWQLLQQRDLLTQPQPFPPGWCTELHAALPAWLAAAAAALDRGMLLVIDYALETHRYNAPARSDGTLLAYRAQQACADPLREPGAWDLTAHLCLEGLAAAASDAGWQPQGHCRQGEALLALGLAQRLHALQHWPPERLPAALAAREALLRLVDPAGLGEFRWMAYRRGDSTDWSEPLFLGTPQPA